MSEPSSAKSVNIHRFRYWVAALIEFAACQGLVQVFTTLAGLLVIRTLTKQDYALYAIANGMQTACNFLADIGIGIGVSSIGGRVWGDRGRFGQLLNTALGLRRRLALGSMIVCTPVAAWMLLRNGGSPLVTAALCAVMIAAVFPQLDANIWQISPQLHSQFRRLQNLDLSGAALRLALLGIVAAIHIDAALAASVAIAGNWLRAIYLRRWAREKADPHAPPHKGDRRELLGLVYKSLPNTIFFCFQGQVTLLILSYFGNTTNIADLTALGRLAALLAVFSTTFANLIAPRFARATSQRDLTRLMLLSVGGTALYVAPLVGLAWRFPDAFLLVLGGKYQSLGAEIGWVVLTAGIAQVTGTIWTLNCARAWIRVQSIAFVPVVLTVQAIAACLLDLRQLHGIILFNLATILAPLPIYLADAWRGIGRR